MSEFGLWQAAKEGARSVADFIQAQIMRLIISALIIAWSLCLTLWVIWGPPL